MSLAARLLAGTMHGDIGMCAGTRIWPDLEPKGPPRQPEVDELTKKQRKVYCRVLKDTQDRDEALRIATGRAK